MHRWDAKQIDMCDMLPDESVESTRKNRRDFELAGERRRWLTLRSGEVSMGSVVVSCVECV